MSRVIEEAEQVVSDRICTGEYKKPSYFDGIHAWSREGYPPNPIILTCAYCHKTFQYELKKVRA